MKPTGLFFALSLAAGSIMAGADPATPAAAPAKPVKLSPEISQRLTAGLPKYAPPSAEAKPAPMPDPSVLELPKITVTQKKRPRLGEDIVLKTTAFNELLAKEKLGSFDRNFLNKFTLPFIGTSAATRAREEYDQEQKAQLKSDVFIIARAAEQTDPAGAKALRDAVAKP